MKYYLTTNGQDILAESNNKAKLISMANKSDSPLTVAVIKDGYIVYENKAQRYLNNFILMEKEADIN